MSVLLTQRRGNCPSGPGWNTLTKGLSWFVCLLACVGKSNFLLCSTSHKYAFILIWCWFSLNSAYLTVQHIYHINGGNYSYANRKRLFGMYPAPTTFTLHPIPESLSLIWILTGVLCFFWSNSLQHERLTVLPWFRLTHTCIQKQAKQNYKFPERWLAVGRHKIIMCVIFSFQFRSRLLAFQKSNDSLTQSLNRFTVYSYNPTRWICLREVSNWILYHYKIASTWNN